MNSAMESAVRILVVEDNPNDARLIRRHLTESSSALLPSSIDFHHAESLESAAPTVADHDIDLLLLDLGLPQSEGIETYERARERIPGVPIVVLTNLDDDQAAVELLNRGAQDYLNKRSLDERTLTRAVRYAVERWHRQQRHEETQNRYRSLVEKTPNPIYVTQDDEIVHANDAAVDLLDAEDQAELIGTNPSEALQHDEEGQLKQQVENLQPGEAVERTEGRIAPADGETKYVELVATPVKWNGEPAHQMLFIDITDRRRRANELAEKSRQLEGVFDGVQAAIWMRDTANRFIQINENFRELFDIGSDEPVSNKPPEELVGDHIAQRFEELDQRVFSAEEPIELEDEVQTEQGEKYFLIKVTPLFDDGDIEATVGAATDITAQKEHQQQLEAYEQRFDTVFNNPFSFAAVFRPDGTFKQVNEAAIGLIDATPEDVRNRPLWETPWWEHSTDVQEYIRESINRAAEGEFTQWETTAQVSIGNIIIVSGAFQPVTDADGTVTEIVGIARDITQLREREQRLSVLNRVLRHNLRNSMNAIQGYANLVSEAVGDGTLEGYADTIEDQTDQLLTISEKARAVQKLSDREIEPGYTCDLRDLLADLADEFSGRYPDTEISVSVPDSTRIHADERLKIAIREAVDNAVTHSNQPSLTVSITTTPSNVNNPDDWIDIVIVDNGPGIPEMERTVINEGRETQLSHGTGLGLWLMNWIVRLIGGQMTIKERSPHGTRVVFTVSRATKELSEGDG